MYENAMNLAKPNNWDSKNEQMRGLQGAICGQIGSATRLLNPIEQNMQRLNEQMERLDKDICVLFDRLRLVLAPTEPASTGENVPTTGMSEHANAIGASVQRLMYLRERLRELHTRLEV